MTEGPIRNRGPQPPDRRKPVGLADVPDRLRKGHGSPEAKVYAGSGAVYQDRDPTGDGRVYRKSTPNGNTGWVELGGGGGTLTWYDVTNFINGDTVHSMGGTLMRPTTRPTRSAA
jgi:hypothetical protein